MQELVKVAFYNKSIRYSRYRLSQMAKSSLNRSISFLESWGALFLCLVLICGPSFYLPSLDKKMRNFPLLGRFVNDHVYDFKNIKKSFLDLDTGRINEIPKYKTHALLLDSLPFSLRERARQYVVYALELAQHYRVDPFWIIAVMWTESDFNPKARSRKNARGLMQIMPRTKKHIKNSSNRSFPSVSSRFPLSKELRTNMEMGVYYLDNMLEKFDDPIHATVAYNMGPFWVNRRLRLKRSVGKRNDYLDKVKDRYERLSKSFRP